MRDGGPVPSARVQVPSQGVEGPRVNAEEGEVEDGLGLGQAEGSQVGIKARVRGAKVRDCMNGVG